MIVKPRTLLVVALSAALLVVLILWWQGRQSIAQAKFDAAAEAAEDTAKALRPLIEAAQERADSAEAERDRLRVAVQTAVTRADSIELVRLITVGRIVHDTVPIDARRYTEPRDEIIRLQQTEINALRDAVDAADSAAVAADVVIANKDSAIARLETSLRAALGALDKRPSAHWYIPTIGVGYSATLSRREFMRDGRLAVHDGPSISAVWKIKL